MIKPGIFDRDLSDSTRFYFKVRQTGKQTDGYRRALPLYQLNSALRRRLQIVRQGVRDRSFSRRLRTIQFKHFGHYVFIGCKELLVGDGACRPHHGSQLWKYSVDVAPVFLGEGLVTAVWLQKRS